MTTNCNRAFYILIAVIVLLILAFTASRTPVSHAQAVARATTSPLPTPIPVGGLWLYMGHGQAIQGQCAIGSIPQYYIQDTQWQIVCTPESN